MPRPSPAESATKFNKRDRRLGQDGQVWEITKPVNQPNRWTRVTKYTAVKGGSKPATPTTRPLTSTKYYPANKLPRKSLYTHDNGGRPFRVDLKPGEINVWASVDDNDEYPAHVMTITGFAGVWVPRDKNVDREVHKQNFSLGNTVLVWLTPGAVNKYIVIADGIDEFQTTDQIYDYASPVGNNDVPYPIALGPLNAYYIAERTWYPLAKTAMVPTKRNLELDYSNRLFDLMGFYYGLVDVNGKHVTPGYGSGLPGRKLKGLKRLQKRLWG